jgi:hypothetical protein
MVKERLIHGGRATAVRGRQQFGGKDKRSSLAVNLHRMLSDGYQTYNYQKLVAGFIKYEYRITDRATLHSILASSEKSVGNRVRSNGGRKLGSRSP